MPVNLMQGRIDGDGDDKKKNNSIDLTLEKSSSNSAAKKIETPVVKNTIEPEKHPEVKEIKVKVPTDIKVTEEKPQGNSLKIVTGIVLLLLVSTGVLLFLLNSESQDLRGSVNVLPETNSTQIVDDILAEDFNNDVAENATETEQVDVPVQEDVNPSASSQDEIIVDDTASGEIIVEDTSSQQTVDEPIVIDTSSIIGQGTVDVETESELESNNDIQPLEVEQSTEGEIIQDYDIQSSADVTNELLTDATNNTNNDFSPEIAESNVTVMEEVSESEEIQGETGPGLWISVIVASILSYAYGRRNEKQLD